VLVIDSNRRYLTLVEQELTDGGFQVLIAPDGRTGLRRLERGGVDLVVLDPRLPDSSEEDLFDSIRGIWTVPIIILSAEARVAVKVRALNAGADDYVVKPFSGAELAARVGAVLRRREQAAETAGPGPLEISEHVTINLATRRVIKRGQDLKLTRREFKLLQFLATNAGRVILHEELVRRVWGPTYEEQTGILHSTVWRLRRKIEDDPHSPRLLQVRNGIGYLLATPHGR
jgi:two-component system KDP operon response regulator KdpE